MFCGLCYWLVVFWGLYFGYGVCWVCSGVIGLVFFLYFMIDDISLKLFVFLKKLVGMVVLML